MDSNHSAPAIVITAIAGCDGLWREVLLGIEEAITDTVAEQMRIFGSAGQA